MFGHIQFHTVHVDKNYGTVFGKPRPQSPARWGKVDLTFKFADIQFHTVYVDKNYSFWKISTPGPPPPPPPHIPWRILSSRSDDARNCVLVPTGAVTYQRQCIKKDKFPDWRDSRKKLCRLHVSNEGTIEDFGSGMLQVRFPLFTQFQWS